MFSSKEEPKSQDASRRASGSLLPGQDGRVATSTAIRNMFQQRCVAGGTEWHLQGARPPRDRQGGFRPLTDGRWEGNSIIVVVTSNWFRQR